MIAIKKTTNFGNSSPQRRKERKGIIFRKWMLKISEKPCDFVIEDASSVKFFLFPPPFSPSGGGDGGGRPLRLGGRG